MKLFTWGEIRSALLDKLKSGLALTDIEKSVLDLMEKQKRATEDSHRQKRAADELRKARFRESSRRQNAQTFFVKEPQ